MSGLSDFDLEARLRNTIRYDTTPPDHHHDTARSVEARDVSPAPAFIFSPWTEPTRLSLEPCVRFFKKQQGTQSLPYIIGATEI